jgi:hypothetical protein
MSEDIRWMMQKDKVQLQNWDGGCLWVGIGVILGGLALGLLFLVVSLNRISGGSNVLEPDITVIMSPTGTPTRIPSSSEEAKPDLTPTGSQGAVSGADFTIGDFVEVFGTGGQGLSIRNEPGLSSVVVSYGLDDEIYEIKGGPVDVDGFVWWYLVNPYDKAKQGWGVGTYLREMAP